MAGSNIGFLHAIKSVNNNIALLKILDFYRILFYYTSYQSIKNQRECDMNKLCTAEEAVKLIKDGSTIGICGFVGFMHPEEISLAIEKEFLENNHPRDLTLLYAAGQGDYKERGMNRYRHEGMVKRVIAGHMGLVPEIGKLINENKIEAYNFPQGVITHLFRDIAAGKPCTITHVGLKTLADPRNQGGKLNEKTTEELVELTELYGREWLMYRTFPVDVALIRATTADEKGNLTLEDEVAPLEILPVAQAAKNSGGIVIAQVKRITKSGTMNPNLVKVPGIYIDAIVIAEPENHLQTYSETYNPSYTGRTRKPLASIEKTKLDERKIIGRRASMELRKGNIVNLGVGVPESVADVAAEEGFSSDIVLTVEAGPIGGIPAGGLSFGASINPDCIIDQPAQFDFYDGGGLDIAFLGLAQADRHGNINVAKFGSKLPGVGGFINITQNAKEVIYCGTFTAGGLEVKISDGKLKILKEGKTKKFIKDVEMIAFSGNLARSMGKRILYVTERCVFELTREGMTLIETANGIDPEKDILQYMDFVPIISENLKVMDERIFCEELIGLVI